MKEGVVTKPTVMVTLEGLFVGGSAVERRENYGHIVSDLGKMGEAELCGPTV
jgi:hypothetical protein